MKLSQDEVACNNASFNCFCVASTQTSRDGSFEASVTSLGRHDDIDTEPTRDSKTGRLHARSEGGGVGGVSTPPSSSQVPNLEVKMVLSEGTLALKTQKISRALRRD